jgi:pSer/pThr/pTyr-binding forkhead associated (FHA) protein
MTAVLFLMRAVILVLLWGFVIAAIVAVRHDVFGTRRTAKATAGGGSRTPAPRPAAKPAADSRSSGPRKLVVVEGPLSGQSFALSGSPITIGRADDSTLTLTDDYVSTRHARLLPRGDDWVVEDLGSTNGTYLDRQKISGPTPVRPGVKIRVGKTVMELRR